MPRFDLESWNRLAASAQLSNAPDQWFNRLRASYSEPHRHYHTVRHIDDCLRELEAVRSVAVNSISVEFAIWFHDAVYDPKRTDNEERSAEVSTECLRSNQNLANAVRELIHTTKRHEPSSNPDSRLLLDIDLSILGQSAPRFAQYEADIRNEYSFVPMTVYASKRIQILRTFLERPRIYFTDHFFSQLEDHARKNLATSIATLKAAVEI